MLNNTIKLLLKGIFQKNAAILTVTAFASYALGLVRDRIFAQTFGAERELDAYNAAFLLPDLILNIFVAGALQSAFIPVFSKLLVDKDREGASRLSSSVLNSAVLVAALAGIVAFVFLPMLAPLFVPGFNQEDRTLYVSITRVLLISPLLFAISNTLGSILVAKNRFLAYGLSPVFYNLGIIGGTITLSPSLGIFGPTIGAIVGGLLHLAPRVVALREIAYRVRLALKDEPFRRVLRLMLPKMAGHPAEQLLLWVFTVIASTMAAGSIAIFNFARNFQSVPVSLIGISFATAAFPLLSQHASAKKLSEYRAHFFTSLRNILLLTIPAAIFMAAAAKLLIGLVLGGGEFDASDVVLTAETLAIFSLAIPTESLSHLLARAFYAVQNTLTPVLATLGGLIIAAGAAWVFAPSLGVRSLALGFFIGSVVKIAVLGILLPRNLARTFKK